MKSIATWSRALLGGAIVAALTACGGGGDNGDSSSDAISLPGLVVNGLGDQSADMIFNPWLASIRTFRLESETPGTGDARIATIRYNDSTTIQQHIDFYSSNLDVDTCEILSDDSGGGGSSSNVPCVDGGNAVVINAPNGIWYTISQGDTGNYDVDNELPAAIPAGASVSIPGGEFPSVGAIPISEPAVPVRILPQSGPVSVNSQYQWQSANGPGVTMRISFLEYDSAGNFIDFRINCDAIDDGEFTLPADVIDEITNNTNSLVARYARVKRSIDLIEGVAVFSRLAVAE